jgi:Superinfection immunity protein
MERQEAVVEPISMEAPPPIPVGVPMSSTSADAKPEAGNTDVGQRPLAPKTAVLSQSSSISDHKHFGIGLLVAVVTLFAVMTPALGLVGLLPLVIAVYLLPTIIAFKVRHHYAGWLALINIVFGATGLGWLGVFVLALTGPRKSALDTMGQPSALGLSKKGSSDPALQMSDNEVRSGWKMPVVQAEIFSFGDEGPAVEAGDALKVFFKNPVVGIWRNGPGSSNCVRYNAFTQIRCVAKVGAETKLRVGRTLGRTALTGIGAAILTGRNNALGAAFLDYRLAGDEKDEMVAALIVFSDYSSVVIQSESEEFEKFCALLPPHVLSEEDAARTAEQIDRIKRMAEDGPRVLDEMQEQIAKTRKGIATFAEQAKSGTSFAERDEGRTGLGQSEARLIDELAVLNAVGRLIRLAGGRELPDRQIA